MKGGYTGVMVSDEILDGFENSMKHLSEAGVFIGLIPNEIIEDIFKFIAWLRKKIGEGVMVAAYSTKELSKESGCSADAIDTALGIIQDYSA